MSQQVPVLTEVVTRAWGTDDPRVLSLLRAENQPGRHQRSKAVRQRAEAAGWPRTLGTSAGRQAATAAVRRLEGTDFKWNGTLHHNTYVLNRYERGSRKGEIDVDTMFDYRNWSNGDYTVYDE